jgi:hypothetical protein
MEFSGHLHALAALLPGKEPHGTHWIGGWLYSRADLDVVARKKNPNPFQESNPDRPAFSLVSVLTRLLQLLYESQIEK